MNEIVQHLITLGLIAVALPLLYAGKAYLWNRKYLPAQLAKGKLKKPLGTILKEINHYTFKEDQTSLLKKGNPRAQKLLTIRNLHIAAIIAGPLAFALTGNLLWLLTLPLSFIIGTSRALPVINRRTQILDRIFQIASSSIRFTSGHRAKNAVPPASWNHIQVEKWNGKETPLKMVITFPSGNGPELNAQKAFEKTFEANVTDENIWNFEWDLPHDRVTIEAAPHLPTQLAYPGSADAKWSVFPVGESSAGVASYDVSTYPHVLVGGPSGTGKLVKLSTKIFSLSKGWITVADLEVGDTIFGVDGKPTKVTHLHPIITPEKAYKVTFRNGESIVVDADHLWETETYNARRSRFTGVNEEDDRMRKSRFSDAVIAKVQAAIAGSSDTDTISIPELAGLVETSPERKYLYDLAKRVGPAEQITPKQVFHYAAQVVKQNQMVIRLDYREFVTWYNNRAETKPTAKFPLLKGHYEKLDQLAYELRDSDTLTVDSVLEYLDVWQKTSAEWLRANIDTSLAAPAMVKDLKLKAEGKYNLLPAQILVPVEEQVGMVSKQDVASLLGLPLESVQSLWSVAKRVVKTQTKNRELVELLVSEKTVTRNGNPYFTYPKKLILSHLVKDNETALWDQRDKMLAGFNVVTTQEIADSLKHKHGFSNHYVRMTEPLEFSEMELPINPYVFGAWLGDGHSSAGQITGIDHEIFFRMEELGYSFTDVSMNKKYEGKHEDYRVPRFPRLHQELKTNGLLLPYGKTIREHGEVKHIPAAYFISSIEQRRELLRGLLDTDGSVSKNTGDINFHSSNEVLVKDVKRLIASLGYIPYVRQKTPTYMYKGERMNGKTAYTVAFQADPSDRLFGLARKNEAHKAAFRGERLDYRTHTIVGVERVESVPMRCISVDSPDRLFLVSDSLIPTHNSVLQRNIVFHTIQHNDRWRFLGVDLKRVELTPYNKYKKTVMGIATDVERGLAVLKYAYNEMMDRYKMMEEMGVNNVMDMADPPHCILLMVDEATMFLGASGSKTEEGKAEDAMKGEAADLVGKILRLGRASGIHMLIAMQRPDATVLRGEFKANMDVRLAAGRMDSTPSSMILDSGEAVNLPGIKGRGLIRVGGNLTVFQGYFAPQDWIDDFILKNPHVEPSCVAPGGHLHEKFEAMRRLEARGGAAGDGEATPAADAAPATPETDGPKRRKGLGFGKKKDTEENAASAPAETAPAPAPSPAEPVPASYPVEDSSPSESQQALLEALNKKEEREEGAVNELPDFFTGSARKDAEPAEPELELEDDDFILDDFDDDEDGGYPEPPADLFSPAEPEAPKPDVKHEWVAASPFGEEPVQPELPLEEEEGPSVPEPVLQPVRKPAMPQRPVRPEQAQAPVRPQRPVSPFAGRPEQSGKPPMTNGNPFSPKRD